MILVQMYNIFRLLIGVPDYGKVVSRMKEKKNMEKTLGDPRPVDPGSSVGTS